MAEVTPEFLGDQIERLFTELRRFDNKLVTRLDQISDDITVLTGMVMRQDAGREGRELSAAGLLAGQRRLADRLTAVEAQLERLQARQNS